MHDSQDIDIIARRITWAHWKVIYPNDASLDEMDLWVHLGDRDRDGYRAAALAVASMRP